MPASFLWNLVFHHTIITRRVISFNTWLLAISFILPSIILLRIVYPFNLALWFCFPGCSYVDEDGKLLAALSDTINTTVKLGSGDSELIITTRSGNKVSSKTLGSREYLRYYHQKPRPSPANDMAITAALAARYSFNLCFSANMSEIIRGDILKLN